MTYMSDTSLLTTRTLMTDDEVETFVHDLATYSRADTHRHLRGHVKVMAQTWDEGMDSLLCVQHGNVHVLTGAELDETALCVPRRYINVHVVKDHDNMFQLTVLSQARDGPGHGIFVAVKNRHVRNKWLAWLYELLSAQTDHETIPCLAERGNVLNGSLPLVKWIF